MVLSHLIPVERCPGVKGCWESMTEFGETRGIGEGVPCLNVLKVSDSQYVSRTLESLV